MNPKGSSSSTFHDPDLEAQVTSDGGGGSHAPRFRAPGSPKSTSNRNSSGSKERSSPHGSNVVDEGNSPGNGAGVPSNTFQTEVLAAFFATLFCVLIYLCIVEMETMEAWWSVSDKGAQGWTSYGGVGESGEGIWWWNVSRLEGPNRYTDYFCKVLSYQHPVPGTQGIFRPVFSPQQSRPLRLNLITGLTKPQLKR